jgi:hypothetical protein
VTANGRLGGRLHPGSSALERTRFEQEIQDLDLQPQVRSEIGGFWVRYGDVSTMRIVLIDPSSLFASRHTLRDAILARLQEKFSALDPQLLDKYSIQVRTRYQRGEPAKAAKKGFGPLDFPVYLLGSQHPSSFVKRLMTEHGIPETVMGADVYDQAKDGWESRDVRAVGIPSGLGHRKVACVKTQKVFADAGNDVALAFVNVISHEIGHMGNRARHSSTGLMKYPVRLDVPMDFSADDRLKFLANLVRLQAMK